jgi:predicted DNA-binding transcriptional regulator AlpA
MTNDFMTIGDLVKRYGVGRETLRRWVVQGKFPKPCRPGGGHPRWRIEDIRNHEKAKA